MERQKSHSSFQQFHTFLLRPEKRTRCQKCGDIFWDKKRKTCLTRTPTNWFAIGMYYAAFVTSVFLILYISMIISSSVASRHGDRPEYVLDDSFVGSSPALNYVPLSKKQNLLWLKKGNNSAYTSDIDSFFDSYADNSPSFNPAEFKNCSKAPFGYNDFTPCIFLRINRLIGWKPLPYGPYDKLPKKMPEDLKKLVGQSKAPKVWVSCEGTTASDRDHVNSTDIEFQGEPGFPASSFPFKNKPDYIDPILAIKVKLSARKMLVSITCRAWAKKLDVSKAKVDLICYFE